jgi:hypothetical protein
MIMLIAGILLQGGKSPSPLAARITEIKIAYANIDARGR